MTTLTNYAQLLNEALIYGPPRVGYWRIYKHRLWRLCGSKAYKGRREEILARYRRRRKLSRSRKIIDELLRDSILGKPFKDVDFGPQVFSFKPKLPILPLELTTKITERTVIVPLERNHWKDMILACPSELDFGRMVNVVAEPSHVEIEPIKDTPFAILKRLIF